MQIRVHPTPPSVGGDVRCLATRFTEIYRDFPMGFPMGFPNRIQTLFGFLDTRSEPNIITNVTIMGTSVATKGFALLCAFLLCWTSPSLQKDKHSLYYIYTALSKPVEQPGIYQFTSMGLLDDRQIDYYNSQEERKIPKQRWMKEKMQEDYWEKGTQSRKSKEQWFNVNVDILIKRMRHNESDVHVLQWRHGCEIEKQGDKVRFSRGIDEYSYDGDNFLSFDDKESQWVAPVEAALQTKRKWDNVPILNQYTKGYLEKECVDWLNKFREYGDEELRKGSPPKVYLFAKKSIKDKPKLKLTCLATGFYPKDVMLTLRKYRTPLPEYDIESTGIRPNHDETFQLEKSVFIQENEKAEYDCFVFHKTLSEPIIVRWDGKCINCNKGSTPTIQVGVVIGVLIAVLIAILLVAALLYLYKTKRLVIPWRNTNGAAQRNDVAQNLLSGDNYSNGHAQTAANGHAQTAANGHAQTAANGHAQTAANGHAQTAANGHAQTAANGHAQTAANGHAQTAANGGNSGMEANV